MACGLSLGFYFFVPQHKTKKGFFIVGLVLFVVIAVTTQTNTHIHTQNVHSMNRTVHDDGSSDGLQFNQWNRPNFCANEHKPTIYQNSTIFLADEGRINRRKRLNRPKSRRFDQSPRVIYRNITVSNEILQPLRIFHRPGEEEPFIVELYVVADEKLMSSFSHDIIRVVTRVNEVFKVVNSLFAKFNVQFVVVGLEIWEKNRVNLGDEDHFLKTLAGFKRTEVNVRHDCLFAFLGEDDETSTTRGRGNEGVMCRYSSCVAFIKDSQYLEVNETARTAAHELGHNFGLRHDTEDCECQGCIMATGVEFGTAIMAWSPCSERDMPNLLQFGMGACLRDRPVHSHSSLLPRQTRRLEVNGPSSVRAFTSTYGRRGTPELLQPTPAVLRRSLCGNAKIDPGEECDCGTVETCPKEVQACCDARTCRLRSGAECATGSCCEIKTVYGAGARTTCRLRPSGAECRSSRNSCDLPEYCDGQSEWCPADYFKTDGEACYTKEGYRSHCIRGGCNAPDEWCRTLWGPTGEAAGTGCVGYNLVRGGGGSNDRAPDSVANCGRTRPRGDERWREIDTWPTKYCHDWSDAECGRLWCTHRNEKAMLLGSEVQQRRVDPHSQRTCVALVYDPPHPHQEANISIQTGFPVPGYGDTASVTQDAGMTPDGTPCQRGLCYNGSCIRLSELPFRKTCNCNSHGVCNNLGHCHCDIGYAPPNCIESGNGGSIDSGPPPPSWHEYGFIFAICFIVFIMCPTFMVCMYCLLCRYKKRRFIFPKSEPILLPSYAEPFDWRGFFDYYGNCCRIWKPHFDNDPPVIIAFGPPNPKEMTRNGAVFATTTKGWSRHQNGHAVEASVIKQNRTTSLVHAPSPIEAHRFSSEEFRHKFAQGLMQEGKKPEFLRKVEAAWDEANRQMAGSKNSTLGSSGSSSTGGGRVEISSPRLENTTFKGETRSLASAARIQQQQRRVARAQRQASVAPPPRSPGPARPPSNATASPLFGASGTLGRSKSSVNSEKPAKPDISAPTLQTFTYKHDLVDLPEAYSTLKNHKRSKRFKTTADCSTLQPKR